MYSARGSYEVRVVLGTIIGAEVMRGGILGPIPYIEVGLDMTPKRLLEECSPLVICFKDVIAFIMLKRFPKELMSSSFRLFKFSSSKIAPEISLSRAHLSANYCM